MPNRDTGSALPVRLSAKPALSASPSPTHRSRPSVGPPRCKTGMHLSRLGLSMSFATYRVLRFGLEICHSAASEFAAASRAALEDSSVIAPSLRGRRMGCLETGMPLGFSRFNAPSKSCFHRCWSGGWEIVLRFIFSPRSDQSILIDSCLVQNRVIA